MFIRSWAIDIHFGVRERTDFRGFGPLADIDLPLYMALFEVSLDNRITNEDGQKTSV